MTKMIPPVPTSAVLMPTPKQKIGFSIESIVGNDATASAPTAVGVDSTMTNNINNNSTQDDITNHNTASNQSTASGPTSPPQTPPSSALMGTTHLPGAPHLSLPVPLALPHSSHLSHAPHPHAAHLPSHLSPAQQQALHQHLLMQHQQQQTQQSLEAGMRPDIQNLIQRLHNSAAAAANLSIGVGPYSPPQTRLTPEQSAMLHLKRERSPMSSAAEQAQNPSQRPHHDQQQQQQNHPQPPHTPPKSVSPQHSHPSTPPSLHTLPSSPATPQQQAGQAQPQFNKHTPGGPGPLLVPGMPPAGLVRPFPMVGPAGVPPAPPPPQQGMPDIKALPPYINAPPELPPQHNPHLIAAAQFQMAAAIQAGHVLGPAAAAAAAGLPPHAAQFMHNSAMPRDSYQLYPWLLSRHGRLFPHRFPGNFLLQPFRKPKRIRTAFSPSQLLKLEHAFESNQYVVGAERKALAQSLNLSETQVKVWFQNRRTKHKRMQQEDEKGGNGGGSSERNSHHASCDEDDDDELIDMEMDDCGSDEEHELDASH